MPGAELEDMVIMQYFEVTIVKPDDLRHLLSIGLAHPVMTDVEFANAFEMALDLARLVNTDGVPDVSPFHTLEEYQWVTDYLVRELGFFRWNR